ncbi:hypothetical protein [Leptospira meyeri]|uniref:hypothetical protein n=1 Tax=Leptospira meyeri TaxID=29508 RepID=UPI0010841492|nr:hypothetical protein [Leptospira meyeri]TGM22029.1 hypothetical protein EHQ73_09545 [Leptospira meyeri]
MSNINIGTPVRLKGDHKIMTVTKITGHICGVTWTISDSQINNFDFDLTALEIVPEKEVNEERRRINKRENAKFGLTFPDQFNKIVSPSVAIISVIAIFFQTYRLKDLEDKIDSLIKSHNADIVETKTFDSHRRNLPIDNLKKPNK